MEAQIVGLEHELQKACDKLAMAQNENRCLSKGTVPENSKYFYMKNEGKLIQEIQRLEAEKAEFEDQSSKSLHQKMVKDEELKFLREMKNQNQKKISDLERDISESPSISDLSQQSEMIERLKAQIEQNLNENNDLQNELLNARNASNSHIKGQRIGL